MITHVLEGEKENAIEIQRQYKSEYDALTVEQRAEYVAEFEAMKENSTLARRHTSRGCIQEFANVSRNMQIMVCTILSFSNRLAVNLYCLS